MGLSKFLKWIIIILFLSLAILSVYYKYNHCSTCNFEYEEKKLKAQEFMDIYHEQCILPSIRGLPNLLETP